MKKLFLLAAISFGILSVAQAQLLFNENFSYSAGQLTNVNAGTSVSGGAWVTVSGTLLPISVYTTFPGVPNYDGYSSSGIGNIAGIIAGGQEDIRRPFTDQTTAGTTVYAAFLVNIYNRSNLLTGATGDYFAHFTNVAGTGGGFYNRVLVKSSGNGVNFGMQGSTALSQVFSTTVFDTLKTHLIIVSYEIVSGVTNDVTRMWINPNLSNPLPTPDITQVVSAGTEPDGIDAFGLRQGTNTPNAGLDGIRVASTFSDVAGNPVTLPSFSQASTTSATISWKPPVTAAPAGYTTLVFVKQGSAITIGTPSQGPNFYTANADFSGTSTAFENDGNAKNVYKGDDSSVVVTGLSSGNNYYIMVYSVKDADSTYSSAALTTGSIIINPVLSFNPSTSSVGESGVNDTVTVTITNAGSVATSADVALLLGSGTASQGVDFTFPATQTITFPASSSTDIQIIIPIVNDGLVEGNEYFVLKLQNPTNSATFGVDSVKITIIDDDFNPAVGFTASSQQVNEASDSVSITVTIGTPNVNPTSVDVVVATGNATNGSDYNFSTTTLTFPGGSSASQTFSININEDANIEGNEYFKLMLQNVTNGGVVTTATDSVVIIDNDYNYYSIDDVNNVNGSGVPDSSGVKLGVRGIVYGINTGTAPNVTFFIRDNTGGIGAFSSKSFGYTVTEGDSVAVVGTIATFRGLTQLSPLDTIILLGTGATIKSPTVVTTMSEATEADLIKINMVRLVNPAAWPPAGGNSTLSMVSIGGDTLTMFVDRETDIDGTTAPAGYFNVTGMGSQFAPSSSAPFVGGYQIVPMRLSDIEQLVSRITFNTIADSVDEDADTAFISVSMTSPSIAAVTADVVVSGGTATAGTDFTFSPATQTLTFPANSLETFVIKVPIIDDLLLEADETFILKLQNVTAGTDIGDSLSTVTIVDNESDGISENATVKSVIYPNPTSGVVSIEAKGVISSVRLFDITGKEISFTVAENAGNSVKADFSNLQPGIYILRTEVNGRTVTNRLVKQ